MSALSTLDTTKSNNENTDDVNCCTDDNDDDDDRYHDIIQSVRGSDNTVEIAVCVTWPNVPSFCLSTCLAEAQLAPLFSGTAWAGTRVWPAAMVALQYLISISVVTNDSRVVELGAGLGVPGVLLQKVTGCTVVLTDLEALVEQMRRNLQQAFPNNNNNATTTNSTKIRAEVLDWSAKGVQSLVEMTGLRFDVVLNCDCIFEPLYGESWKFLVECQEAFLIRNPNAFMLTSCERRRHDGIEKYLQALDDSPVVGRVEQVKPLFDYPSEVELYRLYGITAEGKEGCCRSDLPRAE
jgi:predicted nicotinamide N-methyase